jgi:glycosyltransferase involved in cell wall biosynthesis
VRVALDASLLEEKTTGVALYARELSRALTATGTEVEHWAPPRGASATLFTLNEVPRRLARDRPEVFHAVCNFNLPLQRPPATRLVLTVHDVIPLLLPDTVSTAYRWQFRLWLSRSLRIADAVICVSETTRQALLERFEVKNVHVVHHGVDHVDRVAPPDSTSLRWLDALGLKRFVLYAGALDRRKNVELALEACARVKATLVLAGQRWYGAGSLEGRIARMREQGHDVRPLGYLDAPVFYALMRRASVFVFPSRYEGFGLPPLEAMQLGVPTIVSSGGALPEVCGDGAEYVSPDDAAGLSDAIVRALHDGRPLAARGKAQAVKFTWKECADKTLEVYKSRDRSS